MTAHDALVALLDAVDLEPPAYAWLGEYHRVVPRAGEEEGAFARALSARLYADWHTAGGVAPTTAPEPASAHRSGRDALAAANHGTGSRQGGWRLIARRGGRMVVERDGIRVWADPALVRTGAGEGAEAEVVLPAQALGAPAGFFTALGDAGPVDGSDPADRFYWSIRGEARTDLVAAVSERLDGEGIPFRLKVLNDPMAVRCDAGVLYTPPALRAEVVSVLPGIATAVAGGLRPTVPPLARALAPGIGFAEGPRGGESFGLHRCGLVADGLLRAQAAGARTTPERLSVLADRLAREGVSADSPHLNPGSDPAQDPPRLDA